MKYDFVKKKLGAFTKIFFKALFTEIVFLQIAMYLPVSY